MFGTVVDDGVLVVRRAGARWLSTGFDGGRTRADAACIVSVPEGFERTDLRPYVDERLERAGLECDGPALLTGVDLRHARGARLGPVEAVATAGVSNPAALPMDPDCASSPDSNAESMPSPPGLDATFTPGTVNVVVGVERDLAPGALANLVAVAAEAKAATLLRETGFTGTTTDAVVVACDPSSDPVTFSGSATEVGAAARACVREAVNASLAARYAVEDPPETVREAAHGVVTDGRAEVFKP